MNELCHLELSVKFVTSQSKSPTYRGQARQVGAGAINNNFKTNGTRDAWDDFFGDY